MNKYVELVLNAMVNHTPESLPVTDRYTLLENYKPAALVMTESFRVFQGVKNMGLVFEDKVQNSIFFYANMDEGGNDTLVYNRIVTEDDKISLLELNIIRSRGDAGFMYLPQYCESDLAIDKGWTTPIPEGQKASREELERLASEIYTTKADVSKYVIAKDCFMMENGGLVRESPDYAATMWGAAELPDAGDGLVFIPGDIMPIVSKQDIKAWVIDEEQGIIGLWIIVDGYTAPYIEAHETSSCFVPAEVIGMHLEKTLTPEKFAGKRVLKEGPATTMAVEFLRYYGGEFHGQHRFSQAQAIGARYPW